MAAGLNRPAWRTAKESSTTSLQAKRSKKRLVARRKMKPEEKHNKTPHDARREMQPEEKHNKTRSGNPRQQIPFKKTNTSLPEISKLSGCPGNPAFDLQNKKNIDQIPRPPIGSSLFDRIKIRRPPASRQTDLPNQSPLVCLEIRAQAPLHLRF